MPVRGVVGLDIDRCITTGDYAATCAIIGSILGVLMCLIVNTKASQVVLKDGYVLLVKDLKEVLLCMKCYNQSTYILMGGKQIVYIGNHGQIHT